MSATDELRRLLDERGVEYRWDNGTATWYVDGTMYNAWGYDNERLTMSVCHLTPEQAIAATLGEQGYYTDRDDEGTHIMCAQCGEYIGIAEEIAATLGGGERTCRVDGSISYDWMYGTEYEHELTCGHTVTTLGSEPPSYCPECGAKVVS